ncbi:hypothetical protein AcW1_005915 [Taiwanofungus camphoratus]|nr:hypothetical protein AcW2_004668 [Antrodia cinnamomea]KAI0934367.1 hypothetical protein AcV5_006231 [Antrodia cinnamomea]KAI0934368.1 hypothetical protein AcV5_006231 [Antrodia cinnamomea]KAI0957562.1 hypothetical protein AcW1_005915 [Antrodia cinnamomea]KAI0957563.1 hypothetical protein AcW1_005915 [Antrodia cinnamomea]
MTTNWPEIWQRSDAYHNAFLIKPDPALDHARAHSEASGLPAIAVSTAQGKFLNLIVRTISAKRVLEVGTLGGYSTIWMARALPDDGELVTAELDAHHAKVAQANLTHAGLASKVKIILGPAVETLKSLTPEPPFDLIFIDADKTGNLAYFLEAKRLVRKNGVIIIDNVVRGGRVADLSVPIDEDLAGVRALLAHIQTDPDVDATTLANAGEKGYDGFTYCVRL